MTQAGRLVGAGIVVGWIGAIAAIQLLTDLLFQVRPTDLTTYLSVVGLVAATALVACLVPAWAG